MTTPNPAPGRKFGVYRGKDEPFRQKFAGGGQVYDMNNPKPHGHWTPQGWVIDDDGGIQTN